ncbi:MAG: dicarboxylate/amino acid:cation symporter [Lachnospiraceae bacterium]
MKPAEIEIEAKRESFSEARDFFEKELIRRRVPKQIVLENVLLFEELFLRIFETCGPDTRKLNIKVIDNQGGVRVKIRYRGDRFSYDYSDDEIMDSGASILRRYEDKISLTYRRAVNTLGINVSRARGKNAAINLGALALALLCYLIMRLILSGEQINSVSENVVYPLQKMFVNLMIMISAPVTLFSLVTNLTDVFVMADYRLNTKRMIRGIVFTSIGSAVLAYLLFQPTGILLVGKEAASGLVPSHISENFIYQLQNIAPSDIFQPFKEISPFPLIVLAFLSAYSLCSIKKHFDDVKTLFDSVCTFFCRILEIIMAFFPVIIFLSFLHSFIEKGAVYVLRLFIIAAFGMAGILIMMAVYGVMLLINRINPVEFFKKVWPGVAENLRIGSTIDAIPYNTRFLRRSLGISIDILDIGLPIMSQINLDGNCFIIMGMTVLCANVEGYYITAAQGIVLTILIFALSLGAPNQPGSVLIGLIITFTFVGIPMEYIPTIIFMEAFLGPWITAINGVGNFINIAIYAKKNSFS